MLIFQSCFSNTNKMENRIINYFSENFGITVIVNEIKPAYHLGLNRYQYIAHLSDDPLAIISGFYNSKKDSFTDVSVDYVVFLSKLTKEINKLISFNQSIANIGFSVWEKSNEIDYKEETLSGLYEKYKSECNLNVHIYCFDYQNKDDVEWAKFNKVIDFFKKYPEMKFSIAFSFFTPETFNSEDVSKNEFAFGYDYVGYETCFEGVNYDKRLDHIEFDRVDLTTIIGELNKKIAMK